MPDAHQAQDSHRAARAQLAGLLDRRLSGAEGDVASPTGSEAGAARAATPLEKPGRMKGCSARSGPRLPRWARLSLGGESPHGSVRAERTGTLQELARRLPRIVPLECINLVLRDPARDVTLATAGCEHHPALIGLLAPVLIVGPGRFALGRFLPLPRSAPTGRPTIVLE